MKKLAILLVLLLLLGGAGGAGWWFFLREQPEDESARAEVTVSLIKVLRYIKLDPIVLPIIREGRVMLHVTVVVAIELTTPMPLAELRVFSEPLRDSMLSELHGIYAIRYVQENGYDLPFVRRRLNQAAERVLGQGTVKAVLLKDIIKRSLDTS